MGGGTSGAKYYEISHLHIDAEHLKEKLKTAQRKSQKIVCVHPLDPNDPHNLEFFNKNNIHNYKQNIDEYHIYQDAISNGGLYKHRITLVENELSTEFEFITTDKPTPSVNPYYDGIDAFEIMPRAGEAYLQDKDFPLTQNNPQERPQNPSFFQEWKESFLNKFASTRTVDSEIYEDFSPSCPLIPQDISSSTDIPMSTTQKIENKWYELYLNQPSKYPSTTPTQYLAEEHGSWTESDMQDMPEEEAYTLPNPSAPPLEGINNSTIQQKTDNPNRQNPQDSLAATRSDAQKFQPNQSQKQQ